METLTGLVVAAFLGGIASALMGWADSTGPFSPRKFVKSVLAALVAAAGWALLWEGPITQVALLMAFISGAGVDGLSNRAIGGVKNLLKG